MMFNLKHLSSIWLWFGLALLVPVLQAHAVEPEWITQLALGSTSEKIERIEELARSGDAGAIPILQALQDGTLHVAGGMQAVIVTGTAVLDPFTAKKITPPTDLEKVTINNRVRRALDSALAILKLFSPQKRIRLAAAQELQNRPDEDLLPLIERAIAQESDEAVKNSLLQTQAAITLQSPDAAVRLRAVKNLSQSSQASTKAMLLALLDKDPDGNYVEADSKVRAAVADAIDDIDDKLAMAEIIGNVFSGLSLGSILLLAALGLAITFGLMGIINMAHGELLMIGAYATYVVQLLFQTYWPDLFSWYLLLAVPASFFVAALVGMALERSVIRYLYGRPLETLLATWGISLLLIQTVRMIFGAQNVEVANPVWMSGGFPVMSGLVLPYNRIVIILFASLVLLLVWLLLNHTRLGLFVRAVTQNRTMAECVGVPTRRIDLWTFGLGSGIAGLGGCALSQIGNVGPELGQAYIVDSFLVVVLGGVGQLAGTVFAALGLGSVSKFLEPYAGAVLAKILLLVFIVIFIQKRPQGLFALKGRVAES